MDGTKVKFLLVVVIATFIVAFVLAIPFGISLAAEIPPESLEYIIKANANPVMIVFKIIAVALLGVFVMLATISICRNTEEEVAESARMRRYIREMLP
ncbi:hypothetical protein KC850_04070 [Candidatus Kaiserbacteria bacterium]|nr:hypothetical protein [Candidatus Kaiserbacteria bacterium]